MIPGVFVESLFYVGMQQSEQREKGCNENGKESEMVVEEFSSKRIPRQIMIIVSAFC